MHVFLTGAVGSGKSTAIARYLAGRGLSAPAGFFTRWDRPAGVLELIYLVWASRALRFWHGAQAAEEMNEEGDLQ